MTTPAPRESDVAAPPAAATSAPPSHTGWESVSDWFERYFLNSREER